MATKSKKEKKEKVLKPGNANDAAVVAPAQPITKTDQRKSQEEKQDRFNELIRKNGNNLLNRSECDEVLSSVGLKKGDITPDMMTKADIAARKWLEQPDDRLLWLPPVEQDLIGQKIQVWQTKCRRYRVGRMPDSGEPRFIVAARINGKAANERVVANDLRSLKEALVEAEKFHCEATKQSGGVESNKDILIAAAESNGKWHKLPPKLDPKTVATPSPKAPKSKEEKQPKEKKEKKVRKSSDNTSGEVDKFGSRMGTKAAQMNAILTTTPKNMQQLRKESNAGSTTFYNHCRKLVKEGLLVETKEGFALPS